MKRIGRRIPDRIEARDPMDRKIPDRIEARYIGSHTSGHPLFVDGEVVLVIWCGAGTFSLDAEGPAEFW